MEETTEKGSRSAKLSVSMNMPDKSRRESGDKLMDIWNLNFLKTSKKRHQKTSRQESSPYARKSSHRERTRTYDSVINNLKNDSSSPFRRLSMPGGSGLSSPVYSDANAWVTDSIVEESDTPKRNRGSWVSKAAKSKGPFLGSYQLLGDSLFVRFADQVLRSPAAIGEHGKFCNGYCVSGQTISDLDQRVSKDFTTTDVLVMIGTNDFLKRSRYSCMVNDMKSLLDYLAYTASKIVILTVPPIPRLQSSKEYWIQWEAYNKWLKNLDDGTHIRVIDVAPLFMLESRKPDMKAFESHMGYGDKKRVDHIHLNRLGLLRLNREIKIQLNID